MVIDEERHAASGVDFGETGFGRNARAREQEDEGGQSRDHFPRIAAICATPG
jgi:hypothetical protein